MAGLVAGALVVKPRESVKRARTAVGALRQVVEGESNGQGGLRWVLKVVVSLDEVRVEESPQDEDEEDEDQDDEEDVEGVQEEGGHEEEEVGEGDEEDEEEEDEEVPEASTSRRKPQSHRECVFGVSYGADTCKQGCWILRE